MRILLICLQSQKRYAIPAYSFWRTYFYNGLEEAGHDVVEVPDVDWAKGLACDSESELTSWRSTTWQSTVDYIHTQQQSGNAISLVLSYLYPTMVETSAIKDIQSLGIPCCNFYCDNVREFSQIPSAFQPFVCHWVPEFEAMPMYRKAGWNAVNAPMPCWIPHKFRTPNPIKEGPAVFLGTADLLRWNFFARASALGANFEVRGVGWVAENTPSATLRPRSLTTTIRNQLTNPHGLRGMIAKLHNRLFPLRREDATHLRRGPSLMDDDYVRLTREAKIVLGFNQVPSGKRSLRNPLCYSRLRDIEAPMYGACYLTQHAPGIEQLYDLNEEIMTFHDVEDFIDKLKLLDSDAQLRYKLSSKGQRRALATHTIGRSVTAIAQHLGIAL